MSTINEIKNEFKELLEQEAHLLELIQDIEDILDFGSSYQKWYSRAYKLVKSLAPERLTEFVSYYIIDSKRKTTNAGNYVIQDYIKGISATKYSSGKPRWDEGGIISLRVMNQFQILASLYSRIDSVLQDVTGQLFAELQDSELIAATQLKKISKRAAGALAGVVLERHLQRTAINHKITIKKKNPTISDLNDPLKQAGVYDVTIWRKIQYLADIRNLCSHQKDIEPKDEQIDELISEVNSIIKRIF